MTPSTVPASRDLQAAVARVCHILAVVEHLADARCGDGPPRTRGDVWLCGRAKEIEAFVGAVFADRAHGHIEDAAAARSLERYADALQGGVRELFGDRRGRPKSGILARREPSRPA